MEYLQETMVRRVTLVNPLSQCIRVNGEKGGTTPVKLQASILVKTGVKTYIENGGVLTEGTGNDSNTKVDTYQDAQLDPNNWYLPASDPRGFRKTTDIGISGAAGAVIETPNAQSTLVSSLVEGTHVFRITATNTDGQTATDDVSIVVNATIQNPPVANAGVDQSTQLPSDSVTLNGSGSTAPGSTIASYLWEKISGPSGGTITNPSSVTTTVTGLLEGVYVFRLTVTNAEGLSNQDSTQITVDAAAVPVPASFTAVAGYATGLGFPNQYALVRLPVNYNPNRVPGYRCYIHLHGQGEIGTGTGANGIDKLKATGPGLYFNNGTDNPEDQIDIIPQLNASPGTWEDAVSQACRTWAIANYNIDTSRMIIGGYSLGDTGAVLSARLHPDQWAAVFGASGDTAQINTVSNQNAVVNGVRVADVPYYHVVGSQDTGATNGFKVLDAQGQLATAPRYTALVNYFYGFGHVPEIWNDRLYNLATAPFNYRTWANKFRANDPETTATNFVVAAEASNDIRDYFQALKLVNDLTSSSTKTALLGRLATVLTTIKTGKRVTLLDLGTGSVSPGWNKAAFTGTTGTLSNMLDIDGNATGINFAMTFQQWTPPNQTMGYNLSWFGIPKEVLGDAFRVYNGSSSQTAASTWKFTGLVNGRNHDIYPIYGLRKGDSEQTVQQSTMRITIGGVDRDFPNAMQNTTKLPVISNITPVSNEISMGMKCIPASGQNFQVDVMGFILIETL